MDIPGGKDNKLAVFIYEVMGTAFLLIGINWSLGKAEAIAGIIFIAIVIFNPVSGAHFNPAVTLGVLLTEQNIAASIPFALLTMAGEFIGAVLGCLLARTASIQTIGPGFNTAGELCPNVMFTDGVPCANLSGNWFFVAWMEFIASFIFISFILNNKRNNGSKYDIVNAAAIALALYCMICMVGENSGACMNPAVAAAQILYQLFMNGERGGSFMLFVIYFVTSFLGALFAVGFTKLNMHVQHKASKANPLVVYSHVQQNQNNINMTADNTIDQGYADGPSDNSRSDQDGSWKQPIK